MTDKGCSYNDAVIIVRMHLARIAAAISGVDVANNYCDENELPIRFVQEGEKIAMTSR